MKIRETIGTVIEVSKVAALIAVAYFAYNIYNAPEGIKDSLASTVQLERQDGKCLQGVDEMYCFINGELVKLDKPYQPLTWLGKLKAIGGKAND